MPVENRRSLPRVREPLDEPALYEYAIGALARRMRSVAQLRRLLAARVEQGESGAARVELVLERLHAQRYLDDAAFAADYTRLRQEGARFGRRRVANDLRQKGIANDLAVATLDAAYAAVDEVALAQQYLERKRTPRPTTEKESARVLRRLVAGGFSIGAAYKVLRQWQVAEAALPAEPEFTGDDAAADED